MNKTKNTLYLEYSNDTPEQVADILRNGGIVAIPTETVYGLAANAFDGKAVKKIFEAKGRPQDNPLIVHICSVSQLETVASEIPEKAKALADAFWPGPLSIILKKSERIPDEVSCGLDTVAIRMPSHPAAAAIIKAAGMPLAAPSANLSGSPSPTTAEHVRNDLFGRIDAIVDGGNCEVGVESTVISLAGNKPRLLRPGGISLEQLRSVLGEVEVDPAVLNQMRPGQKAASPGMKYKHYSPKTRVVILKGSFERFSAFVNGKKNCAALCFNGEGKELKVPFVEIGAEHNSSAQARNLFDALRKLDDLNVNTAYARCPDTDGVGLAVINRLLRAAAFTVVDLDAPLMIGLTGQTGSGKSYFGNLLKEKYGFALIDCDALSRRVTADGSPTLRVLADAFGSDILDASGSLIRKRLASIAFASKELTSKLNSIVHPEVTKLVDAEYAKYKEEGRSAVILDAPQLFESGLDVICAFIVAVTAPEELRIERIKKRDGIDEKKIKQRMSAQLSLNEFIEKADMIIINDDVQPLDEQAEKVYNKYKEIHLK